MKYKTTLLFTLLFVATMLLQSCAKEGIISNEFAENHPTRSNSFMKDILHGKSVTGSDNCRIVWFKKNLNNIKSRILDDCIITDSLYPSQYARLCIQEGQTDGNLNFYGTDFNLSTATFHNNGSGMAPLYPDTRSNIPGNVSLPSCVDGFKEISIPISAQYRNPLTKDTLVIKGRQRSGTIDVEISALLTDSIFAIEPTVLSQPSDAFGYFSSSQIYLYAEHPEYLHLSTTECWSRKFLLVKWAQLDSISHFPDNLTHTVYFQYLLNTPCIPNEMLGFTNRSEAKKNKCSIAQLLRRFFWRIKFNGSSIIPETLIPLEPGIENYNGEHHDNIAIIPSFWHSPFNLRFIKEDEALLIPDCASLFDSRNILPYALTSSYDASYPVPDSCVTPWNLSESSLMTSIVKEMANSFFASSGEFSTILTGLVGNWLDEEYGMPWVGRTVQYTMDSESSSKLISMMLRVIYDNEIIRNNLRESFKSNNIIGPYAEKAIDLIPIIVENLLTEPTASLSLRFNNYRDEWVYQEELMFLQSTYNFLFGVENDPHLFWDNH